MRLIFIKKLLSPFGEVAKRIRRARLRRIMRGYRILKQSARLGRLVDVKGALTEISLGLDKQQFSSAVMGVGATSGEIIVRQYLLLRLGGVNLNCALLLASSSQRGSVVFPLPREWRNILERHGFKVAHFKSAMLWQCYVLALLLYGVAQVGKIALTGTVLGKKGDSPPSSYAYFADLGPGNLPQEIDGIGSRDVISWYLQWLGRKADIDAVHHGVLNSAPTVVGGIEVSLQRRPLFDLSGMKEVFGFAAWGLRAIAIATLDCARGRWWHALLLNQAALAAQVRVLPASTLAREYWFHNSSWIYRPLWTYEAARRGSAILFYFYSTNCEGFKRNDDYPPVPYGWKAMNWPCYLVWDEYQADFVRRVAGDGPTIAIVGEIWFHSVPVKIPALPSGSIAVFDVQPVREGLYRTLGLDFEYYTCKTAIQFLSDIQSAINKNGRSLVLKRKRQIGKLAHPAYRMYMESLSKSANFFSADPDIDASRLIEECAAVVSAPYTSTALLGRALGKPSVYFDPNGVLQKDDRAAHGIEILQGAAELQSWLSAIVKN